ncbi:MAG: phage portal protein [Vagococcus salmoninarum]|uniref:phage portal protein n=1 Tax=Vagococcus salmoninarum TaxID=2739 RepID=UPI003F9B2CCC
MSEQNYKSLDYQVFANSIKNKTFYMDRNTVMEGEKGPEVINSFIDQHQTLMPLYEALEDLYLGAHKIYYEKAKEDGKPDHRIAVNFAKYIVDTSSGFFNGNPIQVAHPSRALTDAIDLYRRLNSEDDNDAEVAKLAAVYGHCYKFVYVDKMAETIFNTDLQQTDRGIEDEGLKKKGLFSFFKKHKQIDKYKDTKIPLTKVKTTYVKPTEGFIIYADDVTREPLYCVIYSNFSDEGKKVTVKVYPADDEFAWYFNRDAGNKLSLQNSKESDAETIVNELNGLPMIEFMENEERIGRIETIASLVDNYNKTISDKANDVAYFPEAMLHVDGVKLDESQKGDMKDKKLLNTFRQDGKVGEKTEVTAKFVTKQSGDESQEHLLDRLERLIYQMSMVYNANDESFSTNASGISLEYKLKNMKNIALIKERKFKKAFKRQYQLVFDIWGLGVEYLNIDYKFSFDIPVDKVQVAELGAKLVGQVSSRTRLENMSGIVPDVDDELDRLKTEDEARYSTMDEMYDFNKSKRVEDNAEE